MGRERNLLGEFTGRGFGWSSSVWRLAGINGNDELLLLVDAVVDLWRRAGDAGRS
jgi:hypothetical protein